MTRDPRFIAPSIRDALMSQATVRLHSFLRSEEIWDFSCSETPSVSVIIVASNFSSLTFTCIESIRLQQQKDFQIVLVDNASIDETKQLATRLRGVVSIVNSENRHFGFASNQGARAALSQYLLFLNNDAFVMPGAIDSALKTLCSDRAIGAVGAMLVRLDGKIQEVGNFLLPNGSTVARGKGGDPSKSKYHSTMSVDYCSGAFLLTRREDFLADGGFAAELAPAYFEDVEYCIRLLKKGLHTVVDGKAEVLHVERGSSILEGEADSLISKNRNQFLEMHPQWWRLDIAPRIRTELVLSELKCVFVDDVTPEAHFGQGFGRSALLLDVLRKNVGSVSVIETKYVQDYSSCADSVLDADLVLVSRPQNMEFVQTILRSVTGFQRRPVVVYDSEGLQAKREILRLEILQETELSDDEIIEIVSNEIALARDADLILTVSELESTTFRDFGFQNVAELNYGVEVLNESPGFEERKGILTVGPILETSTPNYDGVVWFVEHVLPWIKRILSRQEIYFHSCGENKVSMLDKLQSESFQLVGHVGDLRKLYDQYRIFVTPTRFSAGISIKTVEAAAAGIPIVATPLVADQLGWRDEHELLVGHNERDFAAKVAALYGNSELWETLRTNARRRVVQDFSVASFQSKSLGFLEQAIAFRDSRRST